jgi:hypothetical protein
MTRLWTEADLTRLRTMMMKQKVTAVEIARSLGRHVGSVKAKARELRLVPLKMTRAAKR